MPLYACVRACEQIAYKYIDILQCIYIILYCILLFCICSYLYISIYTCVCMCFIFFGFLIFAQHMATPSPTQLTDLLCSKTFNMSSPESQGMNVVQYFGPIIESLGVIQESGLSVPGGCRLWNPHITPMNALLPETCARPKLLSVHVKCLGILRLPVHVSTRFGQCQFLAGSPQPPKSNVSGTFDLQRKITKMEFRVA